MRICLGRVTEAAEAFGVDAAMIWEMCADGDLEAERDSDEEPWMIYRTVKR